MSCVAAERSLSAAKPSLLSLASRAADSVMVPLMRNPHLAPVSLRFPFLRRTLCASALLSLAVGTLIGCTSKTDSVTPPEPSLLDMMPPERTCRSGQVAKVGDSFFEDISDKSGIRVSNYTPMPPMAIPINDHSRLAFADLNGDGYDDIVMHSLFPNPQKGIPFEHLVFLNNQDGTFRDASDESGLRNVQAGFFAFGDIDNDGDQDAFAGLDIPLTGQNHQILLNDGKGHFTAKTSAGVESAATTATGNAIFADFDSDGKLDLFLGNGQTGYLAADQLFFGNGDGTFREVTATNLQGTNPQRPTNGLVSCDYDGDGDLDIFVSTYGVSVELGHDILWENDGKGVFRNVAMERGFAAQATGNYWQDSTGRGTMSEPGKDAASYMGGNGFGLDCQDINGDGYPDIFQTNISHPSETEYSRKWSDPSLLLINQGPLGKYSFVNEFLQRGLPYNEGDVDGSTVDFDNDGRFEMAMSRDTKYEGSFSSIDQKSWFGLMHQLPDGKFESVGYKSGINDDSQTAMWKRMKGAQNHAWSDIDLDGAPDLLVGGRDQGGGRPNFLFRNKIGSQNAWLGIRLRGNGKTVNRDALGARVTVEVGGLKVVRELKSSRGTYNSADSRALVFGLADATCPATVTVRWPNGKTDTFREVALRRYQTIDMDLGLSSK